MKVAAKPLSKARLNVQDWNGSRANMKVQYIYSNEFAKTQTRLGSVSGVTSLYTVLQAAAESLGELLDALVAL